MRLLVIGRAGQLARSLAERGDLAPDLELQFVSRPRCDLAVPGSAAAAIRDAVPELVVNAAAFTAVDRAEQHPDIARRINAQAAGEIAAAAEESGAPLIHISTDYVFDGSGSAPIGEEEPIAPRTVYGQTKAEGEMLVREANGDHLILRTAWVYSPFGTNFVRTMLHLAVERDEIAVVADQVGSPTSALDLADVIIRLAQRRLAGQSKGWGTTLHAAGSGQASWAEVAEEVMREARRLGAPSARIRRIASADYPTPACRPTWSVLDGSLLRRDFAIAFPQWRDSIVGVVGRLVGS